MWRWAWHLFQSVMAVESPGVLTALRGRAEGRAAAMTEVAKIGSTGFPGKIELGWRRQDLRLWLGRRQGLHLQLGGRACRQERLFFVWLG